MSIDLKEISRNYWNRVFENSQFDFEELSKKDWSSFTDKLKKWDIDNILDFGFGGGHWSVILSNSGYSVYSYDISDVCVENLQNWITKDNLNITILPNVDDIDMKFDFIFCNSVLDHLPKKELDHAINMFYNKLNDNGIVFLSFDSDDTDSQPFEELENGLKLFTEGPNKGLIWKYYPNEEIRDLVKKFRLISFSESKNGRRSLWLAK